MPNIKRVAIVAPTHSEENRSILTGLGKCDAARTWDTFIDSSCRAVHDPKWLFASDWDGIIYNHRDREFLRLAHEKNIPCVDINDESEALYNIPKIRPDNLEAGKMAADHFKSLGFNSYAFCGYSNQLWSSERKTGFQRRLRELKQAYLTFETEHPISLNHTQDSTDPEWESAEVESIATWLRSAQVPLAIFACDDARAAQIAKAVLQCGLKSPSEIAILGANNESFLCEISKPSLSSIDLNGRRRGDLAAITLNDLMYSKCEHTHRELRVSPLEIVSRQSTNASAVEDKILSKAIAIIQDEACNGLRVSELVRRVHTSRRLLERKFQQHLGISPNNAIRDAQVSKIKGLINHTDMSLTEIAYATGFEHPEYMNVVFKRISGMTPGRYRNRVSGAA